MNKCAACKRFLSPKDAATCATCKQLYHPECVGIAAVVPANWACPECKAKQKKTDNSATPVKSLGEAASPARPAAPASPASPAFSADAGHASRPNRDSEFAALRRDLDTYMSEQRQFREEMRTSLRTLTQRMDGLEERLEAVDRRAAEPMPVPQGGVDELQRTVERLEQELKDRDQDALLSDLDIGHVPETRGENVVHTVTVLAAKLGVTVDPREVVFAERVGAIDRGGADASTGGGGAQRPRRIVVRLVRRQLRHEILQAARVRRSFTTTDADMPGPPRRVYFNERLTRTNRLLFQRVREESSKRHWKYAWTRRGRIHARQSDGSQVYYFRSEADVTRVFGAGTV